MWALPFLKKERPLKSAMSAADKCRAVATADPPDWHALELADLEQFEKEISARRRKIQERISSFPSESLQRQERAMSDERRALHTRIDELKTQLGRS